MCTCGHVRSLHNANGCRINGCPCEGYRDLLAPEPEDEQGGRRMVVEIPDGYFAVVSVYPLTAAVEDTTDGS